MSLVGSAVLLQLTGMMSAFMILTIIENKYLPENTIRPEMRLWFMMIWPYVLYTIVKALLEGDE